MIKRLSPVLEIPVLTSARLRLRGHRIEDFQKSANLWANPKVVEFIGGEPSSEQQSWSRFITFAGHWAVMGFGYWLVEEKETGTFVGEVGFADFNREIEPSMKGIPEAGWVLSPQSHGKGYATEALRTALDWGERHFDPKRTVCIIHEKNVASMRVADKCGFKLAHRTTYKDRPTLMYFR